MNPILDVYVNPNAWGKKKKLRELFDGCLSERMNMSKELSY